MPDLGDYAVNVLAAYGMALAVLALVVGLSMARARRVRRALEQVEGRRDG
jgi:heme exporter protein D